GCFMSLYTDKASHFKTTRYGGVHYNVRLEQNDTQIKRALSELGITLIFANSPQAKGRIERLFGFLQDRLIKEMRLRQIKDYKEANRFLKEEFLPWYNQRYTLPVKSSYRPLPENCKLENIFCIKHPTLKTIQ
ncbi:MAG: ISNCY family transposase, partial [Thermodesulfovibrionales bacterium]